MRRREPAAAGLILLELCGVDQALIGDIVQAYASGASRAWYWRQVSAAAAVQMAVHVRVHKRRTAGIVATFVATLWVFTDAVMGGHATDLSGALRVEILSTGWLETSHAAGTTRLVPTVSFRLRNTSGEAVSYLQVNAVFHRGGVAVPWGNGFRSRVAPSGVKPGAATEPILIASSAGYTGSSPGRRLIQRPEIVDASVELFGKSAARKWTRLGEYAVARHVMEP